MDPCRTRDLDLLFFFIHAVKSRFCIQYLNFTSKSRNYNERLVIKCKNYKVNCLNLKLYFNVTYVVFAADQQYHKNKSLLFLFYLCHLLFPKVRIFHNEPECPNPFSMTSSCSDQFCGNQFPDLKIIKCIKWLRDPTWDDILC